MKLVGREIHSLLLAHFPEVPPFQQFVLEANTMRSWQRSQGWKDIRGSSAKAKQ